VLFSFFGGIIELGVGSGFVPIVKEVNESDVPQPSGLRSQLHDGQNDININNIMKVSNTMSSANPH